jgi:hypothetical protein
LIWVNALANKRLARIHPQNNDVVDDVQYNRDCEYLADSRPAFIDQRNAVSGLGQNRPQLGRPAVLGVMQTGDNREGCSDRWLQDEPEAHRAAEAIRQIFYGTGEHS